MLRHASFLILLILGFACSPKATPKKSVGENISYSENIDHLLPNFDKETPEVVVVEKPEVKEVVEIVDDNAQVGAVLEKIIENNKAYNNGQGFRIQVFLGNSRPDFENARSYLLRGFPHLEIYESYSQPTYKIKAGDFITFYDAEKYLNAFKQRFGTARIVSDKINIKKALNIK